MGRTIELGHELVEIGRSGECALAIKDDGVSRRHARIKRIFGLYFVSDLESANGTFVNGQRVSMAQLSDGDQIRVGGSTLKFVANHHEAEYSRRAFTLATIDPLTGAHNKRHFDDILAKETRRAVQHGTALCLVLLDIDHFKRINDTFGHHAGDWVLARVAETIKALLDPGGLFCRVGGEEFAVIAPNTERKGALAASERIRAAIERASFDYEGRHIPVTVSLGVAEVAPMDSPDELYQRADEKLYASKTVGRNRVT
jgi:two-component system, cell cycle response regulator